MEHHWPGSTTTEDRRSTNMQGVEIQALGVAVIDLVDQPKGRGRSCAHRLKPLLALAWLRAR